MISIGVTDVNGRVIEKSNDLTAGQSLQIGIQNRVRFFSGNVARQTKETFKTGKLSKL